MTFWDQGRKPPWRNGFGKAGSIEMNLLSLLYEMDRKRKAKGIMLPKSYTCFTGCYNETASISLLAEGLKSRGQAERGIRCRSSICKGTIWEPVLWPRFTAHLRAWELRGADRRQLQPRQESPQTSVCSKYPHRPHRWLREQSQGISSEVWGFRSSVHLHASDRRRQAGERGNGTA